MSNAASAARPSQHAGPVSAWPRPIPARRRPPAGDELFALALGEVRTPLADAVFDPVRDRLTGRDGSVIENYYREHLGLEFYRPLDKSAFPLPPCGWCSWYYYYQEVSAPEVLTNACWLAEHLGDYGMRWVQIDDGWQGVGHGRGENRDWTAVDARFRTPGMDRLAAEIRQLGLEAGLWLCPHGQSNERVVRDSGAFLLGPDGESLSDTWVGRYLLDPSLPAAQSYLRELFATLRRWGYSYFKLDGQPIVLKEYARLAEQMRGPFDARRPRAPQVTEHYRATLRTIRDAVGPDAYLLGCWGIPLPGVGILDGSRTADDVTCNWEGFLIANDAVQRWNFLHNVVWYCDPDVCVLRPPLADGAARAWATLQGLSGQALFTSDRLPDLPPARVALLKRICPPTDIRPLDLFAPRQTRKPTWVLKVAQELPGVADPAQTTRREYDVLGLFNYDAEHPRTFHVSWAELGLDAGRQYHVFDFWSQVYLGAWEAGVFVEVPPADVRVLTLVPAAEHPALVSTDRHITQGWVELRALTCRPEGAAWVLEGRSRVIADEPYVLTVGLPRAAPTFALTAAQAGADAADVSVRGESHQGCATVTIRSPRTREVDWSLRFEPAEVHSHPVQAPDRLMVVPSGPGRAELRWRPEYSPNAGYQVLLDGRSLGVAFRPHAVLRGLEPDRRYVIGVRSVWYDGTTSPTAAEIRYRPPAWS